MENKRGIDIMSVLVPSPDVVVPSHASKFNYLFLGFGGNSYKIVISISYCTHYTLPNLILVLRPLPSLLYYK